MKTYDEIFDKIVEKAGNENRLAKCLNTSKALVNKWTFKQSFPKSERNIAAICEFANIAEEELFYAIEKEKETKCRRQAQKYMQKFLKKEKQCKKNK